MQCFCTIFTILMYVYKYALLLIQPFFTTIHYINLLDTSCFMSGYELETTLAKADDQRCATSPMPHVPHKNLYIF